MTKYNDKFEKLLEKQFKSNNITYLTEYKSGNHKFVKYVNQNKTKMILVQYYNYYNINFEAGFDILKQINESINIDEVLKSTIDYLNN